MFSEKNMSVEEDFVEYWIFPELSHSGDDAERLEELRTKCFTFLSVKSRSYIWHEDGINLIQRNESGNHCKSWCDPSFFQK